MIILKNPLLEIKGHFAFLKGRYINADIYKIADFKHLFKKETKSKRILFSLSKIAIEDGFGY